LHHAAKRHASPQFTVARVRQELLAVIEVLEQVDEELNLKKMAGFQIYRFPLDLLRVNFKGDEQLDRCAFVEINEYRKHLMQATNPSTSLFQIVDPTTAIILAVIVYSIAQVIIAIVSAKK